MLDFDTEERVTDQSEGKIAQQPIFYQILMTIGITFVLMTLVQFISAGIIKSSYGLSILEITNDLDDFFEKFGKNLNNLRFAQMINTTISFGGAAILMSYLITNKPFDHFESNPKSNIGSILLIPFLMITILPVAGSIQHLISTIPFPESWLQAQETAMQLQTNMLGDTRISVFAINLIMIAVLPAIFEELLFRGVLQPLFIKWSKNPHLGIVISGFVFGLIHLQIINLIPIAMLGILLGYIYYWTKNIWFPIFAHFFFNGMQATLYFLSSKNIVNDNLQEMEMIPLQVTCISLILFAGITYLFYNSNLKSIHGTQLG